MCWSVWAHRSQRRSTRSVPGRPRHPREPARRLVALKTLPCVRLGIMVSQHTLSQDMESLHASLWWALL